MRKSFAIHTTRTPVSTCPGCHAELDATTGSGRPSPGTVSICAYCNVYLIFTEGLTRRLLTDGEWLALPADQRELLTSLREFNKRRDRSQDKGGKPSEPR